jgi:uncharacterized membrane protein
MLFAPSATMRSGLLHDSQPSLSDVESWGALGAGVVLLLLGATRRSAAGVCIAAASTPLLYRGITGRWPAFLAGYMSSDDTKTALGGNRGLHVLEAIRLELPIEEVYRFWRRLENLPRFMTHLDSVIQSSERRSHWVAAGPGGLRVEWEAEIINEVENRTLGWRSLPGSDVVTAGAVNFDTVRGGRSTQVTVHLQYAPPAGHVGACAAALLGRAPSQTIREDLRRFKQILEAGEIAQAAAVSPEERR